MPEILQSFVEFLALFDRQPALKNIFEKKDRNTEKCQGKSCGKFGLFLVLVFLGNFLKDYLQFITFTLRKLNLMIAKIIGGAIF